MREYFYLFCPLKQHKNPQNFLARFARTEPWVGQAVGPWGTLGGAGSGSVGHPDGAGSGAVGHPVVGPWGTLVGQAVGPWGTLVRQVVGPWGTPHEDFLTISGSVGHPPRTPPTKSQIVGHLGWGKQWGRGAT